MSILQPTYYTRHPDETYSVADPQPTIQPVKQEPVAWMQDSIELYVKDRPDNWHTIPLYAAPVSIHSESETDSSSSSMRTAVRTKDLTDDEIASIGSELAAKNCVSDIAFARAVIAAHKEKNK